MRLDSVCVCPARRCDRAPLPPRPVGLASPPLEEAGTDGRLGVGNGLGTEIRHSEVRQPPMTSADRERGRNRVGES